MADAAIRTPPGEFDEAPVFPGGDAPIHRLFEYLRVGSSVDAFIGDHPTVTRDQVGITLSKAESALAELLEDEADIAFVEKYRHEPGRPMAEVLKDFGISEEELER